MAHEPLVQLHVEFCFKVLRIRLWVDPTDQTEPGEPRILEARSCAGDHWLGRQRQPEVRHIPPAVELGPKEGWSGDSDNREWMAVDLIGFSGYCRVGSVLLPPDSETHNGNWRRTVPVIGIGEEPSPPSRDAERLEEI